MFRPPRITRGKATVALLSVCAQFCPSAAAQNISTLVGSQDSLGLIAMPGVESLGSGLGFEDGIKGGFLYGLGLESTYDSNFFLTDKDEKSEFITNLSPRLQYYTDPEGGADVSLKVNYLPVYHSYWHHSELDEFDQSGDVTLRLQGTKTMIEAYGKYSELSGTDRLTGQFVNGSLLETGVRAGYQLAPRTSLSASLKAAMSDYDSSSIEGADIYTSQVGGYWAATERFSFGPSLRYVTAESNNTGSRDAWAFLMQAKYKAGEKINIIGSLGMEYADSSRENNSTTGVTGDLSAIYAITERLVWANSIEYVTVPSPTETNYVVNNLRVSSSLNRQLLRGTVGIGVDFNTSDYEGVGPVGSNIGTEDNVSTFIDYRRKLFLERAEFKTRLRYTVNDGQEDWSQLQLSAGLEVQF